MARKIEGLIDRLNQAIEESDLSVREISKQSGIDRHLIWQYQNYVAMPSCFSIAKLAHTLGVSTDWLFGLTERKGKQ